MTREEEMVLIETVLYLLYSKDTVASERHVVDKCAV